VEALRENVSLVADLLFKEMSVILKKNVKKNKN
jgi:hypothetical protein